MALIVCSMRGAEHRYITGFLTYEPENTRGNSYYLFHKAVAVSSSNKFLAAFLPPSVDEPGPHYTVHWNSMHVPVTRARE
jgi:hypothetical protein